MRPDSFFIGPRETQEEIIRIMSELESLDYIMMPSQDLQGPHIQASKDDVQSKYVSRKQALETALVDLQSDYMTQTETIRNVIEQIAKDNPRGAVVLSEYYISHKSIRQIAKDLNYNRQHVYKIKDQAVKDAEKYIKMPPPEQ